MGLPLTARLSHHIHWSAVILLAGLLAVLPFASAAGLDDERTHDSRLALRARQALLKDPALGRLNLGVSVRSATAVLWGDVADLGQLRRAEELVRQVPGIRAVRNDLRLLPPQDPVREFVQQSRPAGVPLPRVSLLQRPAGLLTSQPAAEPEPTVTLLPPTAALLVPVAKPDDLSASVARLAGSAPRFRGLRPRIDGGIVRLAGSAGRWQDVMELAQLLSRLDGVDRVILEDIRTPSRRPMVSDE